MMRDALRMIGAGCILAGGILYFTDDSSEDTAPTDVQQLQDEVDKLQSELAKTKEELAIAQTTSSTEKKVAKDVKKTDVNDAKLILTIEPGSNSTAVSLSLVELGIIKDAAAFDAYLAENGLTGKIQIGEHELDASMDFQAIAKKIAKVN